MILRHKLPSMWFYNYTVLCILILPCYCWWLWGSKNIILITCSTSSHFGECGDLFLNVCTVPLTICDFIFKTECLSMVDSLVSFMRSSIVLLSRGLTTALLRMDSVKLIPLDWFIHRCWLFWTGILSATASIGLHREKKMVFNP